MRKTLSLLCLVAFLGFATPAQAQLRSAVNEQQASARLYDTGASSFLLNTLFNPAIFQMRHSVEFSMGSFGGHTSSLGMYTNTMAWQFNDKLAARVDLSAAYSPFNGGSSFGVQDNNQPRVFLRNAEIAYRPSEKFQLHLQVRQSPYGRYMHPYGYHPGMGGYRYDEYYGGASSNLFWRDSTH